MSGSDWFNGGKRKRDRGFMFTASGKGHDLAKPEIHWPDVSHALGMQCRFNGHTRCFYSVAQHCVNVAKLLRERGYDIETQLMGLLHDAGEAYVGDITVPVQRMADTSDLKKLEATVLESVFACASLEVDDDMAAAVHHADKDMGRLEIRDLINDDHGFVSFEGLPAWTLQPSGCMCPEDAATLWDFYYRTLQRKRGSTCVT